MTLDVDKDITSGIRSSSQSEYSLGRLTMSGTGRKENLNLSEEELRHICRTSAAMFIDETGYTAAVLLGVRRALGSSSEISMAGGNNARLTRWRGDLWRLFEDTSVDVLGVLYEELIEARKRQSTDVGQSFRPDTDGSAQAAVRDGREIGHKSKKRSADQKSC
jgi:hypothetical protein